ncbi:hypothetical protein CPC08DRAFT_414306 [Agrocybe pediades]|nr:hypothetical protein CPC08DRAFT_414306 [Agrocybe pediades]
MFLPIYCNVKKLAILGEERKYEEPSTSPTGHQAFKTSVRRYFSWKTGKKQKDASPAATIITPEFLVIGVTSAVDNTTIKTAITLDIHSLQALSSLKNIFSWKRGKKETCILKATVVAPGVLVVSATSVIDNATIESVRASTKCGIQLLPRSATR